ncbi:AbiEi antitoxin N-terminal domain-containing protein [Psychroflexus sp. CAK57W]|uniref:AbiEi antitoxin N-terminal domain-containing protein n=1 Tax=Psychroflexus curvus TaxID=2873595 RepID=UPI001CCE8A16|nr:AbiEi antitoxin N-terminal domain-containing protein [Psychroflexus curvus]
MSTVKPSKINRLLKLQPSGVVLISSWLVEQGYSPELLRKYRNSNWLTSIGTGAMIRENNQLVY